MAGIDLVRAVVDAYLPAAFPGHAPHPDVVPMAGVAAADPAVAVLFQADDGQVGADAAGRVQEMGIIRPCPAASCAGISSARAELEKPGMKVEISMKRPRFAKWGSVPT